MEQISPGYIGQNSKHFSFEFKDAAVKYSDG
jgi:hypothetical protein